MLLVVIALLIIIIAIISMQIKLYIKISKDKLKFILKVYIFKKILIAKIDLKDRKKKRKKKKTRYINKTINDRKSLLKMIYKTVKENRLNLEKLDLKIDACTTDPILTAYLVMILSNIITFILKKSNLKIDYKNCRYVINPLYINKKILNIKIDCIISSNNVHIIYIIYKNFRKWRRDINGRRTSNRKPYDNCNEQYKRNDRCKYNNR